MLTYWKCSGSSPVHNRDVAKRGRRRIMSTIRAVLLVACALLAVALAKSAQQDRGKPGGPDPDGERKSARRAGLQEHRNSQREAGFALARNDEGAQRAARCRVHALSPRRRMGKGRAGSQANSATHVQDDRQRFAELLRGQE